jgi:hypothetical protein
MRRLDSSSCDRTSRLSHGHAWQDRIAATHLMPDLKWAKVEGGRYFMERAQYDACNEQL